MSKIKVMTIFGTRPEAIKMAPLALELSRRSGLEALCFAGAISARIFLGANGKKNDGEKPDEKGEEK